MFISLQSFDLFISASTSCTGIEGALEAGCVTKQLFTRGLVADFRGSSRCLGGDIAKGIYIYIYIWWRPPASQSPPPRMGWVQNLRFSYIFMEPAKTHGIYTVLTSSASETVVFAAFCNTTLYTTTLIVLLLQKQQQLLLLLPLLRTTTYYYVLLRTTYTYYVLLRSSTYYVLRTTYYYVLRIRTTYMYYVYVLRIRIRTTYYYVLLRATTYYYVLLRTTTYYYVLLRTTTYKHIVIPIHGCRW